MKKAVHKTQIYFNHASHLNKFHLMYLGTINGIKLKVYKFFSKKKDVCDNFDGPQEFIYNIIEEICSHEKYPLNRSFILLIKAHVFSVYVLFLAFL